VFVLGVIAARYLTGPLIAQGDKAGLVSGPPEAAACAEPAIRLP